MVYAITRTALKTCCESKKRTKKLAEAKSIPHGLALRSDLVEKAQDEVSRFFALRYDSIEEAEDTTSPKPELKSASR
jgi:hypothetical protein